MQRPEAAQASRCLNTPEAWSIRAGIPESWRAARWSEQGQQERFAAVLGALKPEPGELLLDYGCGTGALCERLPDGVRYLGYDWARGMVSRACRDHPGHLFTSALLPYAQFDLVAAVGPFNLVDRWSKQDTWHRLRLLWDSTGCRAMAVSLYAGDDPDCLSYTVEECVKVGAQLGFYHEATRWRSNDILLTVRR